MTTGDWCKILKTLEEVGQRCCEVLWIRPEQIDLEFIKNAVEVKGLKRIVSVGCGCGLLEWLLQAATGVHVIGIEIDPNYWNSKYFNRTKLKYIPLLFPQDEGFNSALLDKNAVLLFCYFNNRKAFNKYIDKYLGSCVIIIGPGLDSGRHTDPQPFDVDFKKDWTLVDSKEIRDSKDFIAVYVRKI
uniref:Methyltransferase domain-containing protein n=1 Tax=Clastoptera arizonana TaxID=38151 RepID=A0A1B6DGN1_9HEMI